MIKRLILTGALLLTCIFTVSAQENVFTKGTHIASVGIGLPIFRATYRSTIPPVSTSYEMGIFDFGRPGSIGVGGFVGFWGLKDKVLYKGEVSHRYFHTLIGARGAYHFTILDNWEVYAGAVLGLNIRSTKESGHADSRHTHLGFGYQAFAGTRYMFTPSLGAYAEFGNGISYGSIGITFRF